MKLEFDIDFESVNAFKEVMQILDRLDWLQSITTDHQLLQDLKETISHYEAIKHDMLIDIANELGTQFEDTVKTRAYLK